MTDLENSARTTSWQTLLLVILALVLAVGLVSFTLSPLRAFDTGWSIRTGEWIWEHKRLPDEEPLRYTTGYPSPQFGLPGDAITEREATRTPTLQTHWLGHLLHYAVWSEAGSAGLALQRTLLLAIALVGLG